MNKNMLPDLVSDMSDVLPHDPVEQTDIPFNLGDLVLIANPNDPRRYPNSWSATGGDGHAADPSVDASNVFSFDNLCDDGTAIISNGWVLWNVPVVDLVRLPAIIDFEAGSIRRFWSSKTDELVEQLVSVWAESTHDFWAWVEYVDGARDTVRLGCLEVVDWIGPDGI